MRTFVGAAAAAMLFGCAAAPPPVQAPTVIEIPPAPSAAPVAETPVAVVRARGYRLSYAVPPGWTQEVDGDRVTMRVPGEQYAKIVLNIMRTQGPSFAYAEADALRADLESSGWTITYSSSSAASFGGRDSAEASIAFSRPGPDPSGPERRGRALLVYDGASLKTALLITGEWPESLEDVFSAEIDEQRRTARLVPVDRTDGARAQ